MRVGRIGFSTVLVGAMAASTMQLFALGVLAAEVIEELDISRSQIGILGASNSLVGALVAPPLGRVTDRVGARNSVVGVFVASSVGLTLTAVGGAYWMLIGASILSGLPQGWSNSATNKLIALHLGPGERGVVTGIKQSGVQLSLFLAGTTLPIFATGANWRVGVAGYGVLSLALAGFAWAVIPPDPRGQDAAGDEVGAVVAGGRLDGFVYRVAVYAFALGAAAGGVNRFLPLFAHEELGWSLQTAGLAAGLTGLLGIGARIMWGRLAEGPVTPRQALLILAGGSMAAIALLAATGVVGGWLLWPTAVLIAFTLSAWNVVAMLAVIRSVPAALAGRGTGTVMFGFLGGVALSAPAVGWSVDVTGTYNPAWLVLGVVALAGSTTMLPDRFNPWR
ncbi:MAG: MFS transporter [Actinomycetia bacterium]|nr:MFS transporter [Actinomycetes bacterium]